MFTANGNDIRIPKGDCAAIPFTFLIDNDESKPYLLPEGKYVKFTVYETSTGSAVSEKITNEQSEEGTVVFSFSTEETNSMPGVYCYDLKFVDEEGVRVDTVSGFPVKFAFTVD